LNVVIKVMVNIATDVNKKLERYFLERRGALMFKTIVGHILFLALSTIWGRTNNVSSISTKHRRVP